MATDTPGDAVTSSSDSASTTPTGAQPQAPAPSSEAGERPPPPDAGTGGVHNPGGAPGAHILDGPAEMTVGSRKKSGDGKKR